MIPETRGSHLKKYDFSDLEYESYKILKDKKSACSYRNSAFYQGYRVAVRTIDGEIRAYFLGKIQKKEGGK